jgi:hypothetical protein
MSDVIWFKKPLILLHENKIHEIFPKSNMSKNRKINAITRLIIIITVAMFFMTSKFSYLASGIISLGLIYIISSKSKEGFKRKITKKNIISGSNNPLDNGLIGNEKNDPATNAYGKVNNEIINDSVKQMIKEQNSSNSDVNNKLFKDLGENMEFDRSMRQFYTTANTTTPNDQDSFANFCYGDMISGKEGNRSSLLKNSIHLHKSHL